MPGRTYSLRYMPETAAALAVTTGLANGPLESFSLLDLEGFAWGRFGPRTEIRRAGRERLWALIAPEQKPGLLRRLFGRSGG